MTARELIEAVPDLIAAYADTWRLLLEYDEDKLAPPPGTRPSQRHIRSPAFALPCQLVCSGGAHGHCAIQLVHEVAGH